jgi:hypothetical protein
VSAVSTSSFSRPRASSLALGSSILCAAILCEQKGKESYCVTRLSPGGGTPPGQASQPLQKPYIHGRLETPGRRRLPSVPVKRARAGFSMLARFFHARSLASRAKESDTTCRASTLKRASTLNGQTRRVQVKRIFWTMMLARFCMLARRFARATRATVAVERAR